MTLSVKKEVEQTWQMPVKLPMLYLRLFNPKSKIWICLHTAIVQLYFFNTKCNLKETQKILCIVDNFRKKMFKMYL